MIEIEQLVKQTNHGGTILDFQPVPKSSPSIYRKNVPENSRENTNDSLHKSSSVKLLGSKLVSSRISHSEESKYLPPKAPSADSFTGSKRTNNRSSYSSRTPGSSRLNSAESKGKSLPQNTSSIDSFTSSKQTSSRSSRRPNNMRLKNGQFVKNYSGYLKDLSHRSDYIDDPNEPFEPGPGDIDYYRHPALNGDRAISCVARVTNAPHQSVESAAKTYGELIQRGGLTLLGTYHTLMSIQNTRAAFHTEPYDWSSLPNKAIIPVSFQGEKRAVVYVKENGRAFIYESGNKVPVDTQRYKLLPDFGYIGISQGILPRLPYERAMRK